MITLRSISIIEFTKLALHMQCAGERGHFGNLAHHGWREERVAVSVLMPFPVARFSMNEDVVGNNWPSLEAQQLWDVLARGQDSVLSLRSSRNRRMK